MASAQYRQKTIDVEADSYLLRAIGNDLLFDGYLRAWRENDKENDRKKLPGQLKTGEPLKLLNLRSEQKFTEPPSRYTDGTLIKELDNLEIGRPSTYASIVSTILLRNYVERERGVLKPTELGQTVNRILVAEMDDIFNVRFTAQMEEELDFIESGTKEWVSTIEQFYKPFRKSLDRMQARTKEIKGHLQEDSGEKCNLCGASMLIKWSRNGKFLACSDFPKCKNTRTLNRTQTKHHEVKVCPECGSPMQVKESRFGKFWACTHYPQCKMTLPFSLGIPCPEQDCDGEVVERKTRKGKTFYGCSKYPQCHFATWNEPVQRSCTQCGYPILEKKTTRNRGEIVVCPRCKTEHDTTG
jgi:DNA topoisomerase-1